MAHVRSKSKHAHPMVLPSEGNSKALGRKRPRVIRNRVRFVRDTTPTAPANIGNFTGKSEA